MPTLMGHLAQFSTFAKQGEILCTQSLAYLLRTPAASDAFSARYLAPAGLADRGPLNWKTESYQMDKARPDIEAMDPAKVPVVKIEGKLGAEFGDGQLRSYAKDLERHGRGGLLLILVPSYREDDAKRAAAEAFALAADGPPWRLTDHPGCLVEVATWEDVLVLLASVPTAAFGADLLQFQDLYHSLSGDFIEPVPPGEWRARALQYRECVNRATQELAPRGERLLPLRADDPRSKNPYVNRFVLLANRSPITSYYSIGLRDAFPGYDTPFWLRFHCDTGKFAEICRNLETVYPAEQLLYRAKHLWIPLRYDATETDGKVVAASLVHQARKIAQDALPESSA